MWEACFDAGCIFLCWRRVLMQKACFNAGGVF